MKRAKILTVGGGFPNIIPAIVNEMGIEVEDVPYAELNAAAEAAGVTVVGTGVNPGFVLDLLPVIMTRPCVEVSSVRCARIVNAMRRRKQLQLKLGAGIDIEEFERRKSVGAIGHVGLRESAALIARGLVTKKEAA